MPACKQASKHGREATRHESSWERFGTRLRPPPIARASEQARKQARTHASKQARANAANQAIAQAREQASKVASKQSRKHARKQADTQADNQPSKGATMTMTAEMVVGWGSASLLTVILHDANARGPAFLSWSECVLGPCVCRGGVVGSQKHRAAGSCSSVGVRGFQASRTDNQL